MSQTEITVVLDKSGSMSACIGDTFGGYNLFVEEQKDEEGVCLTLMTFSNHVNVEYKSIPINKVKELNRKNYTPAGGTALLDAIGSAIKYNDELVNGSKKMIVIITDGQENVSKKYKLYQINDLITDRKEKGWEFVFMGANQDAITVGSSMGIQVDASLTFDQQDSTQEAFASAAAAVKRSYTDNGGDKKVQFTKLERSLSAGPSSNQLPIPIQPPKLQRS